MQVFVLSMGNSLYLVCHYSLHLKTIKTALIISCIWWINSIYVAGKARNRDEKQKNENRIRSTHPFRCVFAFEFGFHFFFFSWWFMWLIQIILDWIWLMCVYFECLKGKKSVDFFDRILTSFLWTFERDSGELKTSSFEYVRIPNKRKTAKKKVKQNSYEFSNLFGSALLRIGIFSNHLNSCEKLERIDISYFDWTLFSQSMA